MARPRRLEFAGALYHVTSRGNRREPIYERDEDRESFLARLRVDQRRLNVQQVVINSSGTLVVSHTPLLDR